MVGSNLPANAPLRGSHSQRDSQAVRRTAAGLSLLLVMMLAAIVGCGSDESADLFQDRSVSLEATPYPSLEGLPAWQGKANRGLDQPQNRPAVIAVLKQGGPATSKVEERLTELTRRFSSEVAFVFLLVNDPHELVEDPNPTGSPLWSLPVPILVDVELKATAKLGVSRTPTFLLFDSQRNLVYRGPLDDNLNSATAVQQAHLQNAIANTLKGNPVAEPEIPVSGYPLLFDRD